MVVVLREPVSRDLSSWNHQREKKRDFGRHGLCSPNGLSTYEDYTQCALKPWAQARRMEGCFWNRIGTLGRGLYAPQLANWAAVFPRKHILVLQMAAMLADPVAYIERIRQFLGLPVPARPATKVGVLCMQSAGISRV